MDQLLSPDHEEYVSLNNNQEEQKEQQIPQNKEKQSMGIFVYLYFLISAVILTILLINLKQAPVRDYLYTSYTQIKIAESTPSILGFENNYNTTQGWIDVIRYAKNTIKIAAYYSSMWCINGSDPQYTCPQDGDMIIQELADASNRGVQIEMVIDSDSFYDDDEIERLYNSIPNIIIKYINVDKLFGGVQHSKFIISDDEMFYLGSANFDWRALTLVKELGFVANDKVLCSDLLAIYNQYKLLSTEGRKDDPFQVETYINQDYLYDQSVQAKFNMNNTIQINDSKGYIALSPPGLLTVTRSHDIDGIVKMINEANSTVRLETMDYSQTTLYSHPQLFDSELTPALINAALRGVKVTIILQQDTSTKLRNQLETLISYKIDVYFFDMPQLQDYPTGWDHTYLIHSKFIVVDDDASAITTSNFSPDYFSDTFGVTYIQEGDKDLAQQLIEKFDRDKNSEYSTQFTGN